MLILQKAKQREAVQTKEEKEEFNLISDMMSDEEDDIENGVLRTFTPRYRKKEFNDHMIELDRRLMMKCRRKRVAVGYDLERQPTKAKDHSYFVNLC